MLTSLTLLSLAALASASEVLLITKDAPPPAAGAPCAAQFLGTYGVARDRYDVYRGAAACAHGAAAAAAHVVPVADGARIVYLQEAGVDARVRGGAGAFADELGALMRRVRGAAPAQPQQPLRPAEAAVLYAAPASALVALPAALLPALDTLLPRLFVPVVLPAAAPRPVPPGAVKHLAGVLAALRFDPAVAAVADHLSIPQMRNDIRFLTGEDGVSGITSRHSFAAGARTAAAWIAARMEDAGAACALRPFLVGFAPNVVCRFAASTNTTATVLLGAHYDSRGTFGSTRAPGGDDDGSGVLALLGAARAVRARRVAFRAHVELVAFAGEEQGLLGSRAYAAELQAAGANVTLMIQADMLAYRAAGEPPQLGQPDLIGTPEAAQLVANVSALYSPELTVGYTPACCSDHQSFHEQGFPATQVFERAGPIVDPMYHNSGDVSERAGYDLAQARSIAKVMVATLLHTAGYDILPASGAAGRG